MGSQRVGQDWRDLACICSKLIILFQSLYFRCGREILFLKKKKGNTMWSISVLSQIPRKSFRCFIIVQLLGCAQGLFKTYSKREIIHFWMEALFSNRNVAARKLKSPYFKCYLTKILLLLNCGFWTFLNECFRQLNHSLSHNMCFILH